MYMDPKRQEYEPDGCRWLVWTKRPNNYWVALVFDHSEQWLVWTRRPNNDWVALVFDHSVSLLDDFLAH
jgi:hypothetical protein